MLRDEIELYTKLTGKDGQHTPICVIGAYLDGYETGKEEKQTETAEWIIEDSKSCCSKCHAWFFAGMTTNFAYCPQCGSRMKGE